MDGVVTPIVEWSALSQRPRPEASGPAYAHTVRTAPHGVLIALVEALGTGEDAAARARAALALVEDRAFAPLPLIVHDCHRELLGTEGVALSLALFDGRRPLLWWLGVGHLPGYVMTTRRGSGYRPLPLQSGVVGQHVPGLGATSLPLTRRDTLIIVTDSVHWDPGRAPGRTDAPAMIAQRLIDEYTAPDEGAIVIAARYHGPGDIR